MCPGGLWLELGLLPHYFCNLAWVLGGFLVDLGGFWVDLWVGGETHDLLIHGASNSIQVDLP
eukprot:9822761-Karenia_brevis.AAC.2